MMRNGIAERLNIGSTAAVVLIVICLSGTGRSQDDVVLASYYDGTRYDFRITQSDLSKTPVWRESEPNPPLSAQQARRIAAAYLKELIRDADDWKIREVALRATNGTWVYVVSFKAPITQDEAKATSLPFRLLVSMDGLAVRASARSNVGRPSLELLAQLDEFRVRCNERINSIGDQILPRDGGLPRTKKERESRTLFRRLLNKELDSCDSKIGASMAQFSEDGNLSTPPDH